MSATKAPEGVLAPHILVYSQVMLINAERAKGHAQAATSEACRARRLSQLGGDEGHTSEGFPKAHSEFWRDVISDCMALSSFVACAVPPVRCGDVTFLQGRSCTAGAAR
jgi:hypothetical protein